MEIPKIIYQTWKNKTIPKEFTSFVESWKICHPSFEFQLWTDEMNEQFINEHYPNFLPIFLNYPYNIQRADAIRYFLLYHFGGIYVDLDVECMKNIDPLIDNLECFFGSESNTHNGFHDLPFIASNAFMGCTKNHPFFEKILEELYSNKYNSTDRSNLILNTTGPFMINRVLSNYPNNEVVILDAKFVSPLSYLEAEEYLKSKPDELVEKTQSAYCIHYHWGTWWNKDDFEVDLTSNPSKKNVQIESLTSSNLIWRKNLFQHKQITSDIEELINEPQKNIYLIYNPSNEIRFEETKQLLKNLNRVVDDFHIISDLDDNIFPFDDRNPFSEEEFLKILNHNKLVSWASINYHQRQFQNDKLRHFPLGFDFHMLLQKDFYGDEKQDVSTQEKLLVNLYNLSLPCAQRKGKAFFCVNNNNSQYLKKIGIIRQNRNEIKDLLKYNTAVDVVNVNMSRSKLWQKYSEYAFVIAPPGNGMDTHRIWECLFLGCIAITQSTGIDKMFKGLPVVILEDLSEISLDNLELWMKKFKPLLVSPELRKMFEQEYWISMKKV